MTKTISYSQSWEYIGKGSYGVYYRISPRRGIKILTDGCQLSQFQIRYKDHLEYFCSKQKLFQHRLWRDAKEEFETLKKFKDSGVTPKPYGLMIVKYDGLLLPGIKMQHIQGPILGRASVKILKEVTNISRGTRRQHLDHIESMIQEKFRPYGAEYHDMGADNIVVAETKEPRVYVVDLTPGYIGKS